MMGWRDYFTSRRLGGWQSWPIRCSCLHGMRINRMSFYVHFRKCFISIVISLVKRMTFERHPKFLSTFVFTSLCHTCVPKWNLWPLKQLGQIDVVTRKKSIFLQGVDTSILFSMMFFIDVSILSGCLQIK